jgi:hypothetical protein
MQNYDACKTLVASSTHASMGTPGQGDIIKTPPKGYGNDTTPRDFHMGGSSSTGNNPFYPLKGGDHSTTPVPPPTSHQFNSGQGQAPGQNPTTNCTPGQLAEGACDTSPVQNIDENGNPTSLNPVQWGAAAATAILNLFGL